MTPRVRSNGATLFAIAFAACAPVHAAENALTVYSTSPAGARSADGYAIVRHVREVPLAEGRNTVRFADVAARIDATTVRFESLTDPAGTRVLEQDFQFDLVSNARLMERYIDREITVEQARGSTVERFTGTLLSTNGGLVLRGPEGTLQIISGGYAGVRLPALPEGLLTRPTLVWEVAAARGGSHRTQVSYETRGMGWWADYNATQSDGPQGCRLDLAAWVTLVNQSGASYPDARLKLVAGDVHRAPRAAPVPRRAMAAMARSGEADRGFTEQSFFEYHLYTLGRTTTLPDRATKQLELFPPAREVPCRTTLLVEGRPWGGPPPPKPLTQRHAGAETRVAVEVRLGFRNAQDQGLGMPLPAGRIRVSRADPADASLQFIGEDLIGHTPRNENVEIRLGAAFDVVAERRQVSFQVDTGRRTMNEEIEVKVRNRKREPVTVSVREHLYRWQQWQLTAHSRDFEKEDANTIRFEVPIEADGEASVRYTVRYEW